MVQSVRLNLLVTDAAVRKFSAKIIRFLGMTDEKRRE